MELKNNLSRKVEIKGLYHGTYVLCQLYLLLCQLCQLYQLIVKDFFGRVNFFIYVEKRSFILTYNRIVLRNISTDSVPQIHPNWNYMSITVYVIF